MGDLLRIRQQSLSPSCRGSIWTSESQSQSSFPQSPSAPWRDNPHYKSLLVEVPESRRPDAVFKIHNIREYPRQFPAVDTLLILGNYVGTIPVISISFATFLNKLTFLVFSYHGRGKNQKHAQNAKSNPNLIDRKHACNATINRII